LVDSSRPEQATAEPIDLLLTELADVANLIDAALAPAGARDALDELAATLVIAFGARAASIALVDEAAGELVWLAAAGAGGAAMVDVRLPINRGIAGYVAATGQSLSVSDVRGDPRFAGDVADRTGFVPTSIDCLPIEGRGGAVVGVLSILDAAPTGRDAELAPAFADVAASLLSALGSTRATAGLLLQALAAAAGGGSTLRVALDRVDTAGTEPVLVELAATLAEANRLGPRLGEAALRILGDVVDLALLGRRR
jgi:hypothetical protein